MMGELSITTKPMDDAPLLIALMAQMGLPTLLDHFFPTQGKWQGLNLEWVTTVWLAYILSEGDRRLSHVQP